MNDLEQYELNAREWWHETGRFRPLYHLNAPRFTYFDHLLPDWNDLSVLDVGCGGGYTCEFLAKRNLKMHGLDLSHSSIKEASLHAQAQGLKIHYTQGDACALPFPDSHFDVVVCVDVFEHVESPQKAISEIARVLKPGGHLLYDTINRNFLSKFIVVWLLEKILRLIPSDTHDPELFITPKEMIEMLSQSNMSTINQSGLIPIGWSFKNRFFTFVTTPLKLIFYLGVARKI